MKIGFTGIAIALLLSACAAENNTSEKPALNTPVADFSPREIAKFTQLSSENQTLIIPNSTSSNTVKRGYDIFMSKCMTCHGYGYQKGATIRLADRYEGEVPAVLALRTDLFADQIEMFVRTDTVGMPPFRFTEIDDEALDDLIAYLTRLNPDEKE